MPASACPPAPDWATRSDSPPGGTRCWRRRIGTSRRAGLYGAPEITVVVGEEAHATLLTALQYLGLGRDRVVSVPTDDQGRMRAEEARAAIRAVEGPIIVAAQAGNVNTGGFDPVGEIAAALDGHPNAWLHVDGAFGLWAAVSPALSHLVEGVERADSWSTDAHKWLNVGYDCGFVAVRDPGAHRAAMSMTASYLMRSEQRENWEYVLDSSRRARGFALYAAIRSLGRDGIRALVERCCALAVRMADRLREADGVEVLNDVVLNQVLVRFGDDDERTRTSSRRSRPTAPPGWAGRRGRAWPPCASASATGRPPRPMPTAPSTPSCAPRAPISAGPAGRAWVAAVV